MSLAGKADPMLVKMAYLAANANVPGDYSDHYKTMVESHKIMTDQLVDHAKAFAINKAIDVTALETAMSIFNDPLSLQTIDSDYEMMYADVESQREIWKANKGFKNDPKGLADWTRKNARIINNYQANQDMLTNIKTGLDGGLYATDQMSKSDLNFFTNLSQYQANQNGNSGTFNQDATEFMNENPDATAEDLWNSLGIVEDGQVVKYHNPTTGEYTYVSKVVNERGEEEIVSVKNSELKGRFDKHLKADNALTEVKELEMEIAKFTEGRRVSYDDYAVANRNKLGQIIDDGMETNKNTLRYLMGKKSGMQKQSFADALRAGNIPQSAQIIAALSNQEGWQGDDGDGVLDAGDFATVENYNAVVDSILNGELDKQTPGASKDMYLDYTDETLFRPTHELYKQKAPTGTGTGKDKKDNLGIKSTEHIAFMDPERKQMKGSTARTVKKRLLDGTHFKFSKDGTSEGLANYDYIGGQWYENYEDEENPGTLIGSADDMVQNVIRTNHEAFQGLETTSTGDSDTYVDSTGVEHTKKPAPKQAEGSFVPSVPSVTMNVLDQGDNVVASTLNEAMPARYSDDNPQGYYWDTYNVFGIADDPFYQTIVLRDKSNNIVKLDSIPGGSDMDLAGLEGNNVMIRVGANYKDSAIVDIETIIQALGYSDKMIDVTKRNEEYSEEDAIIDQF